MRQNDFGVLHASAAPEYFQATPGMRAAGQDHHDHRKRWGSAQNLVPLGCLFVLVNGIALECIVTRKIAGDIDSECLLADEHATSSGAAWIFWSVSSWPRGVLICPPAFSF